MYKFAFVSVVTLIFFLSCGPVSESNGGKTSSVTPPISVNTSRNNHYSWLSRYDPLNSVINRIALPEGYKRLPASQGSFADWLRHLPLKSPDSKVKLYDGSYKYRQDVHFAVINIDPGTEDLQQCADACMRLKAEYHFSKGEHSNIHFKFTSGHNASWDQWRQGYRPVIKGNNVNWVKNSSPDNSYSNFRKYLKTVFTYAGTSSLSKEMKAISSSEIQPGDLFIVGGFPGHAVMVIDVAEHEVTKEKIFLITQSYMPAQEIHILKNFESDRLSPWYTANFASELNTPEWTFSRNCLKRFP